MDVERFTLELKEKYDYSDELVAFLKKAIPALVVYYGEDKLEIIMGSLRDNEIHIQKEGENTSDYLNEYFGMQDNWKIPPMAGAFQHTQVFLKDGVVSSKSIIYIGTTMVHQYSPFDFNDDSKVSSIIHEICHAIKSYGKMKVENNQVVISNGLSKEYYDYHSSTNTFSEASSTNVGLEESLNSYDEAQVMTIMTGIKHEYGAYKSLTSAARLLLQHQGLASALKESQFSGGDEWREFLGNDNSNFLSNNFDDQISAFYNFREAARARKAQDSFLEFIRNYTEPLELERFQKARENADKKTMEMIERIVRYNRETNTFEQETVSKSL